jgi:NAD(P)-dependent dehydrogenase (short-subunit alcohol dehydrogenase family)
LAEEASAGVTCLPFAPTRRRRREPRCGRNGGSLDHDILFNNAGICPYGLAHELTEEAWDAMLDINLKGAWVVARRVIPHLIAQRSGVIINNSSVAGLRGMARLSHYAASKWGLVGLRSAGDRAGRTTSWSRSSTGANTPMKIARRLEGPTSQQIAERSARNQLPVRDRGI